MTREVKETLFDFELFGGAVGLRAAFNKTVSVSERSGSSSRGVMISNELKRTSAMQLENATEVKVT